MNIKVIGAGCENCDKLYSNVVEAVKELNCEAEIEKVEDLIEIVKLARNGDRLALIKLIKMQQNNIYSTLFYLKKDTNDLSDIMQDILIKISRKIKQLKTRFSYK